MANRKGNQQPTAAVVRPYRKSQGAEAAELYERTGRKLLPWQKKLLKDMLSQTGKGLWRHTKFGYSLPRRNGKNEVLSARECYGLVRRGERIMHTAHRTTATHEAWERLLDALTKMGAPVVSSNKARGSENIRLENGGKIEFRTRTSKGGLGEGYDLRVSDEAQEYQRDQESALKYVISASQNPQTILAGTPPTPISSGTVFAKFRDDTMQGRAGENAAWVEWGVERETDPLNKEAWYLTNPSLGVILSERAVMDETGGDRIDFNIQRLGLWLRYNQKSAISEAEWRELQEETVPPLRGKMHVGVKYGQDGERAAMSIAVKTQDGRIFIEGIDCRPVRAGNGWITDFLRTASSSVGSVTIDGASGQALLAAEMRDAGIKQPPILPTVRQIIIANAKFEQALYGRTMCHMGQASMAQAAANCEHRTIGSNGGFGYRSIKQGVDIALLDSAILAHWAASEAKDGVRKQRVGY